MNYYLWVDESETLTIKNFYPFNDTLTMSYPSDVVFPLQVDERVFVFQKKEEYLLPYEFSVVSINRSAQTLVLRVNDIYQNGLPLATLAVLLPELELFTGTQLTRQQVSGIVSLMNAFTLSDLDGYPLNEGEPKASLIRESSADAPKKDEPGELTLAGLDVLNANLSKMVTQFESMQSSLLSRLASGGQSEEVVDEDSDVDDEETIEVIDSDEEDEALFEETEVLDYVKDRIRKQGYYFDDETVYNYHICLKTRPFVILAGLSGTGKSKLAQLYAEALGQDGTFKRLPVRPNWNDDRYLLGHLNTITGEYITEPAVEFVLAAIANQKKLYSLCLDEMNLAHVEYYFSQFLSAMEGDSERERRIELMSQRAFAQLQRQYRGQSKKARLKLPPAEICLPDNLLFTGTINVDETTQPISDKVIDRANTIEFFNIDLNTIPEPEDPGQPLLISNRAWQSYRATRPDSRYRAQIVEIDKILKNANMGLGYRIVREIELYLANSSGLLDPLVAFDLQCKQRILPRIHGSESIDGILGELITFSKKHKLDRTEKRLQEMRNRLKRDGYTSFWR
ncbi:McrB family protein [Ktedonobacter racemifer]|uniref:GTPase subunit of restriction endonuclease n=1 Tax=Ktedonobacter racemifer DSM 44963 TaxID=485913 RepID=D6TX20_KTERA|nr:hypothetical protein [Ktedonobacter racemifer]EFH84753.1 GTPase subunit of restriction endonuclease [Ktedonobacter racemifer DSM 44963]